MPKVPIKIGEETIVTMLWHSHIALEIRQCQIEVFVLPTLQRLSNDEKTPVELKMSDGEVPTFGNCQR